MTISTPAQWRVILAFVFDLITSFAVFGYIVAVSPAVPRKVVSRLRVHLR